MKYREQFRELLSGSGFNNLCNLINLSCPVKKINVLSIIVFHRVNNQV